MEHIQPRRLLYKLRNLPQISIYGPERESLSLVRHVTLLVKLASFRHTNVSCQKPQSLDVDFALPLRSITAEIEMFQISHGNAPSRLHSIVSASGGTQYALYTTSSNI